jgi:hypothetical protein
LDKLEYETRKVCFHSHFFFFFWLIIKNELHAVIRVVKRFSWKSVTA